MEIKKQLTTCPKEKPKDESKLGFGHIFTDHMLVMPYDEGQGWHDPVIMPYGDITLSPSAMCLHYGQEIFEGLKAYRTADGSVQLFRPQENFKRMNNSAERMVIPKINEEDMLEKAAGYRNEIVKLKVQNYSDELNAFNNMLDESLYDKNWGEFYPDERIPYWRSSASLQIWFPWPLVEEWEQDSSYRKEMMTYGNVTNPNWPEGVWTDEEFDNYALYCRGLVGTLGFVSYDPGYGNRFTPRNTDVDLELYLEEMMKYPRKQFLERWESSPLVIKKYEILYAIIRDELGVEL